LYQSQVLVSKVMSAKQLSNSASCWGPPVPMLVAQSSEAIVLTPAARTQLAQLSQSVRAQLGVAQTLAHAQVLGE